MSRTRLDVLRTVVLLAGGLMAVGGCSILPKSDRASSHSQPGDYGQNSPPSPGPDNGVRQASVDRTLPREVSDEAIVAAVVESAEEDDGFDMEDLDPVNVAHSIRDAMGYGPDEGIARDLYREAEGLARAKEHKEAGEKFLDAAKRWPDSTLEEDALFLAGENFFAADEYPDAQRAYEKLLQKHDYTHHLDAVTRRLFKIAEYWEKCALQDPSFKAPFNVTDDTRPWVDTVGHALKAYDDIRMYDPTGPLADDAVMATANLYFVRGRYEDAARNYDLIRTEYTKSDHQLQAHLYAIESWQRIYQGGYYDAGPLEKAAEVADQTLAQFGPELGEDRARVVAGKNKLVEEMAARDLIVAGFYDKKKRYGAARIYYNSIVEEYPQTAAAEKARQRLSEIAGKPDKPTDHFKWLTSMFEREQYD